MGKNYFLAFFLTSFFSQAQQVFYVSATGSTANGQTAYTTIAAAKTAVATYNSANNNDIVVNISPGTYVLSDPLTFGPTDSGDSDKTITYQKNPNEPGTVIISGGKLITGWTYTGANNIWSANISGSYSRQVYRNGVKLIRAKSSTNYGLLESTDGYFAFCDNGLSNLPAPSVPSNPAADRRRLEDVEIVSELEWKTNWIPLFKKCPLKLDVLPLLRYYTHLGQFQLCGAPASRIENAKELIDGLNEWYIDRSGAGTVGDPNKIYLKTESSTTAPTNVVVPVLEALIIGDDVNNVVFDGLTFQYTNWNRPSNRIQNPTAYPSESPNPGSTPPWYSNHGFILNQADNYYDMELSTLSGGIAATIPGGVRFINSENVVFRNNVVEYFGGAGIRFATGCKSNVIVNNTFRNICASGISIGEPTTVEPLFGWNKICNNLITEIATEYSGSVGIFVSSACYTTISHNEISAFPYTGISIGWGWSSTHNIGANKIFQNLIDCSGQTMRDGGGIYTLGGQGSCTASKTEIYNNYIKNFKIPYGALYFDQGSSYIKAYNNVIKSNLGALPNVNWVAVNLTDNKGLKIYDNFYSSNYPNIGEVINAPCEEYEIKNNAIIAGQSDVTTVINAAGRLSTPICN